jgi:hypothetical protein
LVPVAREEEQRVIDANGQAEHHRQHRRRRGDWRDERGCIYQRDIYQRDRDADTQHGGQQRHPGGDERPEHQQQHNQCDQQTNPLGGTELGYRNRYRKDDTEDS